jgi:NADPH2:quinone reductase
VRVHDFGSLETAELADVAPPAPAPGEVLVDVHAVPVNYVDTVTFAGEYQFAPPLPYTPGKGPAGVVRAVGAGVDDLMVGDRVLAMAEYGGYADQVTVAAAQVYALPDEMSFVDAAAMSLAFDTAWMALRERARISPGERVLVLGATGAVGGAAVQLAKAFGAGQVLVAVPHADRHDEMIALGADAVVDCSHGQLRERIRAEVQAETDGAGVDIAIDPLGGDYFDGAIRAMAWRGRLVIVGFAAGRIPTLRVNYLMLKNIEVSGLQISDYRRRAPALVRRCYQEVFGFFERGLISAPDSESFALGDWKTAFEKVRQRRARTRVVLVPNP